MDKCKKCGHSEFRYHPVERHVGKYCRSCSTWQKWIPKAEQANLLITEHPEAQIRRDFNLNEKA